MTNKIIVSAAAVILGVLGYQTVTNYQAAQDKKYRSAKKEAFQEMMEEHEFNQREKLTPKEIKKMPKKDRPDLAWEQDFLLTMDPATGAPEKGRLLPVLEQIQEAKRGGTAARVAPGASTLPWEERGPDNFGGRTRAALWDPTTENKVWAGGVGGGLWFNDDITDGNQVWQKVNDFWDNIAVSCIAGNPDNALEMYVGTGESWGNLDAQRGMGIWKTSNGGASWQNLASTTGSAFRYVNKLLVYDGAVYAATTQGLKKSTNGGTTWTNLYANGGDIMDLELGGDNSIWVTHRGSGVWRSPSGIAGTFVQLNNAGDGFPDSFGRLELATAPSDGTVAYVIAANGSSVNSIFKTTNTGGTWTDVGQPNDADTGIPATDFTRNQAWYDLIAAVDPNNPNHCYVGGIDVHHTLDGGTTWQQISHWYGGFGEPYIHADQHGIVFKPGSSNEIVFTNDGGVTYSPDAVQAQPAVFERNNGYNVTQFYAGAQRPEAGSNVMLAGAQDNGSHRFDAPGINSTDEVTGGDGMFCHISQVNGDIQVTSYVYNNYYVSTNGGLSFSGIAGGENTGGFVNPTDLDDRLNLLYGAKNAANLRRVDILNGTATDIAVGLAATASHIRVSDYTVGSTTLFVGAGGNVYKITNANTGAASTVEIDPNGSLPGGSVSCIEIGANENELLVTYSNYGVNSVWYTNDGGANWTSKEGDLPDMPVRWALFNPNDRDEVILATEVGVWSTSSISAGNPSWMSSNTGLANVRVDMLQYRPSDDQVMAATHGRGVFTGSFFTPSFTFDAGIVGVNSPVGSNCDANFIPEISLKNFGSVDLTNVTIRYQIDAEPEQTFAWVGNILPGNTETVTLPAFVAAAGNHNFTASTENPNGVADEFADNDGAMSSFSVGDVELTIAIITDRYGAETTWTIEDPLNNIVASGGPYENAAANGEFPQDPITVCVVSNCFTFNIQDSFGDGMCCAYGNGSFTVTDANGVVLVNGGDGWTNSTSVEFCAGDGDIPGCTDTGACNYNEFATTDDGLCEYVTCEGCTDAGACNYDPDALIDDASCEFLSCLGCTDSGACNYDPNATIDDNSCDFDGCSGCTDINANNYDATAIVDDGSCTYDVANDVCSKALNINCGETLSGSTTLATSDNLPTCGTSISAPGVWYVYNGPDVESFQVSTCDAATYDTKISVFSGSCDNLVCVGGNDDGAGCSSFSSDITFTNPPSAPLYILVNGYNNATGDFDLTVTCVLSDQGCTDDTACNFNPDAINDDGTCEYDSCAGCTDVDACNYDATATIDDDSCVVPVAGTLSTPDNTLNLCIGDGNPDNVQLVSTGYDGPNRTFVMTNAAGIILATQTGVNIDFETLGLDVVAVWTVAHDAASAPAVGNSIGSLSGCTDLSGAINIGLSTAGCNDQTACNFDPNAQCNDGSCEYTTCAGCTDVNACNFDDTATLDDNSCDYSCFGCTEATACNYSPVATIDDGSCELPDGCTDAGACNYDATATCDDGTCEFDSCAGCTDANACNYDATATIDDGTCDLTSCLGCTDANACNYDATATIDDGTCDLTSCAGCTDAAACNYDATATIDDGTCDLTSCQGCTNPIACNYDETATMDDGTCKLPNGCTDSTACNFDLAADCDDGSCEYTSCAGCTDATACNYDATATIDNGTCDLPNGCVDPMACNYDAAATCDDGSCEYTSCEGCTDPTACDYDENATIASETCTYPTVYYLDNDNDGYGDETMIIESCDSFAPDGYVADAGDCDDEDDTRYPGASGTGIGIDNDCNGEVEDDEVLTCAADLNTDGTISILDVLILVGDLGCSGDCVGDLENDGTTSISDLLVMIGLLGTDCQ